MTRLGTGLLLFALLSGAPEPAPAAAAPARAPAAIAGARVAGAIAAMLPAGEQPEWLARRRAWLAARADRRDARWHRPLADLLTSMRAEAAAESSYLDALSRWDRAPWERVRAEHWREAALDCIQLGRPALAHALLEAPLRADRAMHPLRARALGARGQPDSGLALLAWPPDRRPDGGPAGGAPAARAIARDEAALFESGALADSAGMRRAARAARWAILASDPSPAARREARIHLARSLLAQGEPRLALSVIEPEAGSGADAALIAADAAASAGDTLEAAARLAAFAGTRGVPTADRHAASMRGASWLRGARGDSLPERAWLDLLRTLGEIGEADAALGLLRARRVAAPDSATRLEREEARASLFARARDHDAATAAYRKLLERTDLPSDVRARYALGLGRARRGAGDFAGTDSAFALAATLDSSGGVGEQAAWERARDWEDRRGPREAARVYAWARPRLRSASLAGAARVHGALAWLRAEAADSAQEFLAAAPRAETAEVKFWTGRVAEARGDTAAARTAYRAAWRLGPWTYEGIRAAEILHEAGAWPADAAPFREEPSPRERRRAAPPRADAPLRARLLEGLGLAPLALEALRECARGAGAGDRAACFDALEERGRFRGIAKPGDGRASRWEFPPAFPVEVFTAAERESLDPALLWAIMRQESAYRHDVRSKAGAIGLLQLLPGTASRLARRPVPEDSLYVPGLNVSLGARYVRGLLEEMGDPRAVLAAYNAGEDAVRRWLRDRGPVDDRWVELIPYRETRDYVKQVYAAWRRYEALYGTRPR